MKSEGLDEEMHMKRALGRLNRLGRLLEDMNEGLETLPSGAHLPLLVYSRAIDVDDGAEVRRTMSRIREQSARLAMSLESRIDADTQGAHGPDNGPSASKVGTASAVLVTRINITEDFIEVPEGLLARVKSEIILSPIPKRFLDLIRIPAVRGAVDRDHHDVGYHYHFCDLGGRRSNVLLAFDPAVFDPMDTPEATALFWEHHGPGFPENPDGWGNAKRKVIHARCCKDAAKFNAVDLRRPEDSAKALWPLNTALTLRAQ